MSETANFVRIGEPICTCNDPKYSGCMKHFPPPPAKAYVVESPAPIAGKAEMPDQGCKLPPDGWYCSLEPGHDGPCAALPNRTAMLGQEWVSKVTSSDAPELSVIGAAVDNGMPPHVARAVRTAREYRMAADHSRTPHTNNAIYEVTRWFADDRERLLARVEDLERRYKMLRQDYSDLRRVDAGR